MNPVVPDYDMASETSAYCCADTFSSVLLRTSIQHHISQRAKFIMHLLGEIPSVDGLERSPSNTEDCSCLEKINITIFIIVYQKYF